MKEHFNSSELIEELSACLGKLEGGEVAIGDFSTWFMSLPWESLMADHSSLLHLGWDIQNILYEYWEFPDVIPEEDVIRDIRREIDRVRIGQLSQSELSLTRFAAKLIPISDHVRVVYLKHDLTASPTVITEIGAPINAPQLSGYRRAFETILGIKRPPVNRPDLEVHQETSSQDRLVPVSLSS